MSLLIYRLLSSKYLSRWLVMANDLLFSIVSSFIAVLLTGFIFLRNFTVSQFALLGLFSLLSSFLSFYFLGIYKGVIRHSSFSETGRIGLAAIVKVLLLIGSAFFFFDYPFSKFLRISFVLDILITFFILVTLRMVMISVYTHLLKSIGAVKNNLLIFTNDPHNNMFLNSPVPDVIGEYRMAGFLQIGSESSYRIGGYPSYFVANSADFGLLVAKHLVKAVLFMDDHAVKEEDGRLLRYCEKYKIKMLILPKVNVFNKETLKNKELQEVRVEDLLSRDEIEINMSMIKYELEGKVVMVTGAAGSIGSEICRQLCSFPLKHLLLFDCAETPTHNLRLELLEKFPGLSFSSVLGDVRNKERVEVIIERYRPGVIFHAAAYKHVPLMEENPCEAICTNVYGTRMVADAAVAYGVEKFVMISTDKAVNPTNVMGASKRLAEMYVQSLNSALQRKELKGVTRFVTTRFGNVLGSNGSVIPLFRQQIAKGGPLTVTHPDIIRYFMTIPEACRLVLEAGAMGKGGEIFVFDMGEPVKIADLAYRMITLAGLEPNVDIKIVFTGLRPGEKLYEELLSNEEETLPTPHEKIRVASVRQYEYARIAGEVEKLTTLAFTSEIMPTVRRMKELIPEFISKNSVFEELDKLQEGAGI